MTEHRRQSTGDYVYEQRVTVVFRANGLDTAWSKAMAFANELEARSDVERASVGMIDLHHRPDLDGSLRQ